jgi:hypothetical protein
MRMIACNLHLAQKLDILSSAGTSPYYSYHWVDRPTLRPNWEAATDVVIVWELGISCRRSTAGTDQLRPVVQLAQANYDP